MESIVVGAEQTYIMAKIDDNRRLFWCEGGTEVRVKATLKVERSTWCRNFGHATITVRVWMRNIVKQWRARNVLIGERIFPNWRQTWSMGNKRSIGMKRCMTRSKFLQIGSAMWWSPWRAKFLKERRWTLMRRTPKTEYRAKNRRS